MGVVIFITSRINSRGNRIDPVCVSVCPFGFVEPTLFTTSTVQSFNTTMVPVPCTKALKLPMKFLSKTRILVILQELA